MQICAQWMVLYAAVGLQAQMSHRFRHGIFGASG